MDRKELTNLAGLLDGELKGGLAEKLAAQVKTDAQLSAELDEQQAVKALLAGLPEYEAPNFMATHVLGEIASRREAARRPRWRPVLTWASGALALVLGFGATLGILPRLLQPAATSMVLADGTRTPNHSGFEASLASTAPAYNYAPQEWEQLAIPADTDEQLASFLRFASQAHEASRLQRASMRSTPNMGEAVLILDPGSSQIQQFHWASEGR